MIHPLIRSPSVVYYTSTISSRGNNSCSTRTAWTRPSLILLRYAIIGGQSHKHCARWTLNFPLFAYGLWILKEAQPHVAGSINKSKKQRLFPKKTVTARIHYLLHFCSCWYQRNRRCGVAEWDCNQIHSSGMGWRRPRGSSDPVPGTQCSVRVCRANADKKLTWATFVILRHNETF